MQISAPAATVKQQGGGLAYKWIVAIVVIFGIFMSILDGTIVNIAIPRLQSTFGTDLNSVQWVLTGYTLAQGVATPLTAFLANRIGTKRFYLLALLAFTIGSALCGIAWSLPVLIFFRILQGAGGAFLLPLSITLLYHEFAPEERGTAMGFLGIPILLAPALGPTLGGYIVTYAGWQLIFYINVPIGILGIILSAILLRNTRDAQRTQFDLFGFLFSATGLGILLYGLSDASTDGWGSTKVQACLIIGVLLLIGFVLIELNRIRHEKQPLLDLRVFGNGSFTTSSIASIITTIALYGGLFLVPLYLQSLRGLSAYESGLLLMPQAFASMAAVLIGGRLVDKLGVRAVVIPGLILLGLSLWQFTGVTLTTPYGTIQLILVLRSIGLGLCIQPLTVSALAEIRPQMMAQASSTSTTLRFVASSFGIAVLATMVQTQSTVHYSHLAEQTAVASPLGQAVAGLQALLMSHGISLERAHAGALTIIGGQVRLQGYLLAIQDAFWFTVILTVIAVVATLFVRGPRKKAVKADRPLTDEEQEAEKAREEAMMGG